MLPTTYPPTTTGSTDTEQHRPMDADTQHRLAGLYADLAEVRHDRAWAMSTNPADVDEWHVGISLAERDIWDHIVETATGH